MIRRLAGQLRALWDNAGQLVQLRGLLDELSASVELLRADVQRLDERTRKQAYREGLKDRPPAVPVGELPPNVNPDRHALILRARAMGAM